MKFITKEEWISAGRVFNEVFRDMKKAVPDL